MDIPKNIFFIWLGDNVPAYVGFAIEAFKTANAGFDVRFVHYTLKQLEDVCSKHQIANEYDQLLYESSMALVGDGDKYDSLTYMKLISGQKLMYGKDLRQIQILSDIYRLKLINNFGGIYLDCDCFPIRKFDDELLSKQCFIVERHYHIDDSSMLMRDNYFMGTNGQMKITNDVEPFAFGLKQTTDRWWCNIKFLIAKQKFFNMKLKLGDFSLDKSFYIEHYCDGNWKSKNGVIRTPKCFLDKDGI